MMSTTAPGDDGFNSVMTVVKMMTTTMVMAKLRCMPSMLSPPPPPLPPLMMNFACCPGMVACGLVVSLSLLPSSTLFGIPGEDPA